MPLLPRNWRREGLLFLVGTMMGSLGYTSASLELLDKIVDAFREEVIRCAEDGLDDDDLIDAGGIRVAAVVVMESGFPWLVECDTVDE